MSGRATTAKTRTGSATTLAVASGAEMPRNCGSSSPKTIEKTVARTSARAAETASTIAADSPSRVSGPIEQPADRGLGEVADDQGGQRDADLRGGQLGRQLAAARPARSAARVSPASTACCTVGRSSATSENSAATKTAVPAVNATPSRTSNHSVIVVRQS